MCIVVRLLRLAYVYFIIRLTRTGFNLHMDLLLRLYLTRGLSNASSTETRRSAFFRVSNTDYRVFDTTLTNLTFRLSYVLLAVVHRTRDVRVSSRARAHTDVVSPVG